MARQFSGKEHVGECRITRKSGITYVYERITRYDQESRKTVTVSSRLKGKILPGETEMVPTRPKKPKGTGRFTVKGHVGLVELLKWAGKASGVEADLRGCFDAGDSDKVLSLAWYWLGTDGGALSRLEGWQLTHPLPYGESISEDVYSDLFKSLGLNEDGIQRFFSARAGRLSPRPVIAYDSTAVSTYSLNQSEVRRGFYKEHDGLDTIKLLTLYSVRDAAPIAFVKQPGNMPDVLAMENALEQLRCLGTEKPLVTTDTGYYSEANVCELCRRHMKFLSLVDTDQSLGWEAVDTLRDELETMGAICPFDCQVSGATMAIEHTFGFTRQRTCAGAGMGETETFTRRLHLYAFKSSALWERHELSFRHRLLELKSQVESGVTEFTEAAQRRLDRYLVLSHVGRDGRCHVDFNESECARARSYFGYFVLVSNVALDTFEALEIYRLRERIEELFQDWKGQADGRRPHLWHPDVLRGRMFVQFVTLCLKCFITKKIREVRQNLGKDVGGKTKARIAQEKSLKAWLEQHSLTQIFDWFDCRETTTVETEVGARRWTTESVARDRLFMELLGVTQACSNQTTFKAP